jgi:hypothetical protein
MNVPTTPLLYFMPRAYSPMIKGMLHRKRNAIQAMRNAPAPSSPPFWATILGKRQIFPVPIAIPSALRINPNLDEKCLTGSELLLFGILI